MTANEKAKELIEKFREHAYPPNLEADDYEAQETIIAKQCAVICVQEIIDSLDSLFVRPDDDETDYWQQVLEYLKSEK